MELMPELLCYIVGVKRLTVSYACAKIRYVTVDKTRERSDEMYTPKSINTESVKLSNDFLELTESIAAILHNVGAAG